MEIPVSKQLTQAAAALLFGCAAGILYDVFRAVRKRIKPRAVCAVCDFMFALACGIGLFTLGMTVGEGRQRIFLGAAALLGGALYYTVLSRFVLKIAAIFLIGARFFLFAPVIFVKSVTKSSIFSKKTFTYAQKSDMLIRKSSRSNRVRHGQKRV